MSRRTITEQEIALIKGMIFRGMKNKDIQFFFNRPERPVNSGRISTIGANTYSNSRAISPASDSELDQFISKFRASEHGVRVADTQPATETSHADKAKSHFKNIRGDEWVLDGGENDQRECKRDFDPKQMASVVRAVAALANNKGGFIYFGVSDNNFKVEGVGQSFSTTDISNFVEKIKSHLSPTPVVEAKETIDVGGLEVGFLYVAKHQNPPVIVYRDGEKLNEGEILFRYPGQSSRIKFGDLQFLLQDRDRRARQALVGAAGRIADVGTENVLILDTDKNVLETKGHSILIDQALAETLKFIKEGEFDEQRGAPTLRLVGEVSPVSVKGAITSRIAHAAIFQENILEAFLEQVRVDQPIQYIYAGLAQSRLWLPIFYFARLSGNSNDAVANLVSSLKISQKGKQYQLVERLAFRRKALAKYVTRAAAEMAAEIMSGTVRSPDSVLEAGVFCQALTGIKETAAPLIQLLEALRRCRQLAEAADDSNAVGSVFKAACRVDEMFFSRDGRGEENSCVG